MPSVRKFTFDLRFDGEESASPASGRGDGGFQGGTLGARLAAQAGVQGGAQGSEGGFSHDFQAGSPAARPAAPPPPDAMPAPPPEPAGPPLLYSEEDMEIAREEAYVAGHTTALDEASAATGRAAAEALAACADNLGAVQMVQAAANQEIAELAARVAVEVCRTVLPHTADHYAAEEIIWLVSAVMPTLLGQPRVAVRVNPAVVETLTPALNDVVRRAGFEGKVVIIDDPAVAPTDARVEWAEGGAERNTSRLWDDIDTLLARNIPRFSRAEAVQVPGRPRPPEDEADTGEPDPDPWPDIDHAAWWTPPGAGSEQSPSGGAASPPGGTASPPGGTASPPGGTKE